MGFKGSVEVVEMMENGSNGAAMMPSPPNMNIEAISGILGSISIACWVVVFSPQIIENFRRSSAEGLSIVFLIIWLAGDLFNIVGAILQGVLPTMIILAVYYTLADIVLILQCFYYTGFTLSDSPSQNKTNGAQNGHQPQAEVDEDTPLLARDDSPVRGEERIITRRRSSVDATHLSPVTPLHPNEANEQPPAVRNFTPTTTLQAFIFNTSALLLVFIAGAFGWWISTTTLHRHNGRHGKDGDGVNGALFSFHPFLRITSGGGGSLDFDITGQVFGYLCAVFYLGSRVPQLLLNYRRKSTEGVSILFFLFACAGNLTYVLSIFAYEPPCAKFAGGAGHGHRGGKGGLGGCADGEWSAQYWRYILVNLSWVIGSAGTLGLDFAIFTQFWIYRGNNPVEGV